MMSVCNTIATIHGLGDSKRGAEMEQCNHKPKINLVDFIKLGGLKNVTCEYCGCPIRLVDKYYIIIFVYGFMYFISGIIYLMMVKKFDNTLIWILICGGILFYIIKYLIYKYGKYITFDN